MKPAPLRALFIAYMRKGTGPTKPKEHMDPVPDKPTYGVAGACAYLRVSETSLHDLVESGEIAASKPGRELVFRKAALDDYLMRLEMEQTAQRKEAFKQGVKSQVKTAVSSVRRRRRELPKLPGIPKEP